MIRGELWWADLGIPFGSEPGFRRPVLVVQADAFNRSRINTIVCIPLTSTMPLARAPGNAVLTTADTGLSRDSVAVVSQLTVLDKTRLVEPVGMLAKKALRKVEAGIKLVLGLD